MGYTVTIFKNLYDNDTSKKVEFETFDEVVETLFGLSTVDADKKSDRPLISMARYIDGSTRANANVVEWTSWCAVDVDSFKGKDVHNELDFNFHYLCHSTASSTIEHPKFRLVVPLSRPVKSKEIAHFWYALNKTIGNVVDKQTKDKSRMFYVPAQYKDANNFIFRHDGEYLNVDDVLNAHEFVDVSESISFFDKLPKNFQEEVLKNRKSKLTKNVTWNSYKDCPFVNRGIVSDFKAIAGIDGSGRYSKLYSIMVSIASIAIDNGYPIEQYEIVQLIKEIDMDSTRKYQKRKLNVEASNAIQFAYLNRKG